MTDAPVDNHGKGQAFSPTDLLATALGTCVLTTMAIVAQRHGIELAGAKAHVSKEMVSQPMRRIGALTVTIDLPEIATEHRARLEAAGNHCPVHQSLSQDVKVTITYRWK